MDKTDSEIWKILAEITDPEIPVLSITELGIVRDVHVSCAPLPFAREETLVEIIITPTYSGCPAMHRIECDIKDSLRAFGFSNAVVTTVLRPAWTTDWMSEAGKNKLKDYGIAPPHPTMSVCSIKNFSEEEAIQCPRCNSYNTRLVSRFGSTPCKALYQCNNCSEPFDYFKCH